jgi:hypothetical protein
MDIQAAVRFVATHGRVLEWRRLRFLLGDCSAAEVLAALDAYRNSDGGYGWALEPDLRSATSQPVAAMQALEVLADIGDTTSSRPVEICDWLTDHTLPDGGVPFALPYDDKEGSAPHWLSADSLTSSLMMTAQLAAQAHRIAGHRADVAGHPWLVAATAYCVAAIDRVTAAPHAYELMFALRFLDAAANRVPRRLIDRLVQYVATDGPTPVSGGTADEVMHLIDFTPYADGPVRAAFPEKAVEADLNRLAGEQRPDGGWTVTFDSYGPAAALEWRGYTTVQAVATLKRATL